MTDATEARPPARPIKAFAILALIAMPALAACQTTVEAETPKTTIETDGVKVTIGEDGKRSDGTFCPPGQAKKGNC